MKIRTLLGEMRKATNETANRPGAARKVLQDIAFFAPLGMVGAGLIYFGLYPAGEIAGPIALIALGAFGALICLRRMLKALRLSPLPWATEQEAVEYYRARSSARVSAAD